MWSVRLVAISKRLYRPCPDGGKTQQERIQNFRGAIMAENRANDNPCLLASAQLSRIVTRYSSEKRGKSITINMANIHYSPFRAT